jgi:uncharacterized protein (TIRG00374 family)
VRRFERLSFAAGLLLLAWLLFRIGAGTVMRNLEALGWGFLLVLLLQSVPVLLNTLAWKAVLPPGRSLPVRALAPVLVAGEAINAVSPVGFVGGELLRVSLLGRRIPPEAALGATGLAAMSQCVAQALFVLSGMPVVFGRVDDSRLRHGLLLISGAVAALLGLLILLAWRTDVRDRARSWLDAFAPLRRLRDRVPDLWRQLAPEMLRTLHGRPGRFAASVAASLLAWQTGVLETLLVLALLRQPVGIATAIAIEILAVVIEGILFFVPAKMGTQEGGRVLIFLALGLAPATGLALGFVRRLRELAWAAVGLAVLGRLQRSAQRGGAGPDVSGITRMRPAPGSQT